MKVYYVEYRLDQDKWRADMPFNNRRDAEKYIERQVDYIHAGLGKSLNELTAHDFRISEKYYSLDDK